MRNKSSRSTLWILLAACAALLPSIGCRTARENLPALSPRLFLDKSVLQDHPIPEGKTYQLLTLQETPKCSVHILRVKVGSEVPSRYFKKSDMFISCIEGGAIVQIEDDRYALKPGQSVLVPFYRVVHIIHNGSDKDFVAAVVFAPAYDPGDVYPVQKSVQRDLGRPTGIGTPVTRAFEKKKK